MTNLHPLRTTDMLRESYERYLKTIYPFQDEPLRERFWAALHGDRQLINGPLLEASPPYETGPSVGQLVAEGLLAPGFRQLCATTDALPLDRPLYAHQAAAVANVVDHPGRPGHNLVVATGTGSGKTESFLIPILDHLLREEAAGTLSRPGVRALLLYPMNALANDQLQRLRGLLQGYPAITYGRYTGETLEERAQALDAFRAREKRDPPPNELLSRAAMRDAPPHILLTNYAMLEYLLLRPQDTELFDGPTGEHWRFIVADEAHVYDGATGIEVGMLLRRLRDRVLRGGRGLRCIATSATLGRGAEDFPAAARFAAALFDEPFAPGDVFAATRRLPAALGDTWGDGSDKLYQALAAPAGDGEDAVAVAASIAAAAERHGVAATVVDAARRRHDGPAALYEVLRGDGRLRRLQTQLADGPQLLADLAAPLFPALPPEEAREAAVRLVDLAVQARPHQDDLPLLPARYHVFARALEGAFVCLRRSAHGDGGPRLFLGRHETCPDCGAAVFELATCARCGVAYVVGELEPVERPGERAFRLRPLTGDTATGSDERGYFVLEAEVAEANEDDLAEEGVEAADDGQWPAWSLCLHCGLVVEGHQPPPCGHEAWRPVRRATFRDDQPERMVCGRCRTRSTGIVYRLLTGRDAPVSVLATQLYTQLPPVPADEDASRLPGQGRKLLIFADSRQDAAFTAPYLERTANNILYRRLILAMMTEDPEARTGELRINSLAEILQRRVRDQGVLDDEADFRQRKNETLKWLTRELTESGHLQGLEGLGMLRFRLVRPAGLSAPRPLLDAPWNLAESEAWEVVEQLLDTVRRRGGVRFPDGVEPTDDFFAPRNRPYFLTRQLSPGKASRSYALQGWLPRRGANTRTELLEKLLARVAPDMHVSEHRAEATRVLNGLWEWLHSGPWAKAWHTGPNKGDGPVYQLDADRWEWSAVGDEDTVWRCGRCRHIAPRSLRGLCPVYGCAGELEPVGAAELQGANQHYRYLYRHLQPAFMTVEEHTAQWRPDAAAEIQKKFIDGAVNVLSCSTTFELGVDVGTLNAVLMRNVPPTTANYVQRAGRAGRRSHTAAFALTFAQRRSHDLAYYKDPAKMVGGQVRPPVIAIRNPEIVRRHMNSVLIAAFLRRCADEPGRFGERDELRVGPFFVPDGERPTGPALLTDYLAERPEAVRAALRRIVPESLHVELRLDDWGWLEQVTNAGDTGVMDVAAAMIRGDIELFHRLGVEAGAKETKNGSKLAGYYYGVENTIRQRDLLNEFGRQGVLPKYGFPVDVVPLVTDYVNSTVAAKIELQRDLRLAISEFAPGSQLVAAKTVWTGGGLQKQPQRELEEVAFGVCRVCGRFNRKKGEAATQCEGCGQPLRSIPGQSGKLVKPEFGFVAARVDNPPRPGETRPPRSYTSQVYFDRRHEPNHLAADDDGHWPTYRPVAELSNGRVTIAQRYSRFGELIVLNHGPRRMGFEICRTCGFGRPAGVKKGKKADATHTSPRTGQPCPGYLEHRHLGHDFLTDVLELQVSGPLAVPDVDETGKSVWLSVLYALIEGASVKLEIRRNDLNGTRYFQGTAGVPMLVLYDDVPGGAGHVRRVADALPAVFAAAQERVASCSCGPETACHECLWNYYNQPYHARLSRGAAAEFLQLALGNTVESDGGGFVRGQAF
ncbi:MAG: DEAD/DEAH box helicase [Candidatus Promineofilum sp.]|uniref:DEAD/DEAH box helicase n=1 Tax=Promineifilum sp. TaxID=2664178 RepID=UPI002411C3AB|nr:DEAD/DEAH box helicase [Promineifilum sp.]MCO5182035.1 DEAD/DEAH box helicase [Promineifilum sp.]